MPGAHELQLISRYFGGSTLRWARSMGQGAREPMLAEQSTTSAGQRSNVHHIHVNKSTAPKKQSVTDEELMQVMFNKFTSTKYHGPALPEDGASQPGH